MFISFYPALIKIYLLFLFVSVSFFKSLERVHQVLQKFLQGNATENMKLFMPFPKSKEPVPSVHCDIEVQQRFINALHRLDEIVNLMDSLIKQDDTDFKVEAKIEHYVS